jgi:hypothetical protein
VVLQTLAVTVVKMVVRDPVTVLVTVAVFVDFLVHTVMVRRDVVTTVT